MTDFRSTAFLVASVAHNPEVTAWAFNAELEKLSAFAVPRLGHFLQEGAAALTSAAAPALGRLGDKVLAGGRAVKGVASNAAEAWARDSQRGRQRLRQAAAVPVMPKATAPGPAPRTMNRSWGASVGTGRNGGIPAPGPRPSIEMPAALDASGMGTGLLTGEGGGPSRWWEGTTQDQKLKTLGAAGLGLGGIAAGGSLLNNYLQGGSRG